MSESPEGTACRRGKGTPIARRVAESTPIGNGSVGTVEKHLAGTAATLTFTIAALLCGYPRGEPCTKI